MQTRANMVETPAAAPASPALPAAITSSGGLVLTPVVQVRPEEAHFLEEEREERARARKAAREQKLLGLAVTAGWQALRNIPGIAAQSALLGAEAAALSFEQPAHTWSAVKAIVAAAQEGAGVAWSERDSLQSIAGHAKHTFTEVIEVQDRAPESVSAAVTHAGAAAKDVAQGVVEPSVKKLGEGTVEGTQSAGSAVAAVMEEPGHALGAVKEAIVAGVIGATVPLRSPVKSIKAALSSTKAAGSLAGLTAAAPSQVASAFNAVTAAAREVGTAGGSTLAAANRAPGGMVGQALVVAMLLPGILVAGLAGMSFGLGWELAGRVLSLTVSFIAGCITAAAAVVAWRFPATLHQLPAGVQASPGGSVGQSLAARADSLTLTAARDALLTVRARLEQEAAARKRRPPLKAVGAALSAAGRTTKRALSSLAFWRKRDRSTRITPASTPGLTPHETPVPAHAIPVPEALAAEPASEPAGVKSDQAAGGAADLNTRSSSSLSSVTSLTGQPISTPAGPMLPILALGWDEGPYVFPTSSLDFKQPYPETGEAQPKVVAYPADTAHQLAAAAAEASCQAALQGYAGSSDQGMPQQLPQTRELEHQDSFKRGSADAAAGLALEPASIPPSPTLSSPATPDVYPYKAPDIAPTTATLQSKVLPSSLIKSVVFAPYYMTAAAVSAVRQAVSTARAFLQLLVTCLLITFMAGLDSVMAICSAAARAGTDDTLGQRLHRLGCLLLQLPLLAVATSMAVVDTGVWRVRKLSSGSSTNV